MEPLAFKTFRAFIVVCFLLAAGGCRNEGGPAQRIDVRIAVGGQDHMVYLPTTLAQQLGYYEREGLRVTLEGFPGGAKALQSLLGGSAEVVSGFYDHTIQMAAEGRELKAFVSMLRYPGMVVVVAPAAAQRIQRAADLRGATVGVTAPGSSSHFLLTYLLSIAGVPAAEVTVVGVGGSATALAALENAKVDAMVTPDPAATQATRRNPGARILADTRTAAGVTALFGAPMYPASVLYAQAAWIERNRDTAGRLARAIRGTLVWMQQHTPEEITARMPEAYRGSDPAVYVEALRHSLEMFSPDGVMDASGAEAVRKVLAVSLEKVRGAKIDLGKTYTNEFVQAEN